MDDVSTSDRIMGPEAAERAATRLRALADPVRLRVVSVIGTSPSGEASAGEIASAGQVTAPTVSHHLKVLREAGLIVGRRSASSLIYRLSPSVERAIVLLLDGLAQPLPSEDDRERSAGRGEPDALANAEHLLDRIVERMSQDFTGLPDVLITRTVRESYAALLRTSRVHRYVPILAERFARQRLNDTLRSLDDEPLAGRKPQVLFVCVANAGRSQLAAALLQHHGGDAVVVRSAGSNPASDVHDVVRPLLAEILAPGADAPFPKPLTDDAIRAADVVITMGCGDTCPVLPNKRYEDWAVGDPALASPAGARAIRDDIDRRVQALLRDLLGSTTDTNTSPDKEPSL